MKEELQIKEEIINRWIKKGQSLIYEEYYDKWCQTVRESSSFIFHGQDIMISLNIMYALNNKRDLNEVISIFKMLTSGSRLLETLVRNTVFTFSKRGIEFYEATSRSITKETAKLLEEKRKENELLERKSKKQIIKHFKF